MEEEMQNGEKEKEKEKRRKRDRGDAAKRARMEGGGGGGGKRIGKEGEQKRKEKLRVRATETQRKNKRGQRARTKHESESFTTMQEKIVCARQMYVYYTYIRKTGIEPIVRYMHVKSADSRGEKGERGAPTRRKVDGMQRAVSEKTEHGERKHGERRAWTPARDSDLSRA